MGVYRSVSLTGSNSNELYSLHYPESLLRFCLFDFSNFVRRCTDFCKYCQSDGEYRFEEAVALRNAVASCHKFVEANLHGIYDKLIPDFFIEYICRENGIGTSTLWNNLIGAKNSFERTIFKRLTEYRHNKAVNQWVNLLRMQEYANKKLDFVFGEKTDVSTAASKRDYFDLMFSVASNELGYPAECFSSARIYSVGRLPASPFIASGAAREIAKNTLSQIEYTGSEHPDFSPMRSDNEAMDVFSAIKASIPEKTDAVLGMVMKTMRSLPKKVYVSDSFKAVIDLEIDLIIESGAVLQHCRRCGEYFLRDSEYDHDYCSRQRGNAKTCLEISTTIPPHTPEEIEELDRMTSELYSYMSKRINIDLTQRDFSEWYQSFMAMKESIAHHRLSIAEFREFEQYSKDLRFTPQQTVPLTEPPKPQPAAEAQKQPVVKPFVFERIDRTELYEQENKRLRRERMAAAEAQQAYADDENNGEAQKTKPSAEPKPTVKVMKAEDAKTIDFSVFENPFDGAFDENLSELESIKSREMKPIDDIFSFEGENEAEPEKAAAEQSDDEINIPLPKTSASDDNDVDDFITAPSDDYDSFGKQMARASYMKKPVNRREYAENIYKKTAESGDYGEYDYSGRNTYDEPFAQIQSDGADRMTDSDFDILPSSASTPISGSGKKYGARHRKELQDIMEYKSEPPRITINEPKAEPKALSNKTKRVLDGITKPSKNHNPFINDD